MEKAIESMTSVPVEMPAALPDADRKSAKNTSPMRNIVLLVGLAIFVFLAFTTYSVQKSIQGSAQLSAIKDLYFPVLERVDANIVRLDKIEETILQAVMIAERDPLTQAATFNVEADKAFEEMLVLYPERKQDIQNLRADFKAYHELASSTSLGFIEKRISNLENHTPRMIQALTKVRQGIKSFRQSSYDNFVQTLVDSQQSARMSLYLGIALGVMNLCFMGVLVYFIRNNFKMMQVIAEQNATLECRVAERTAQLSQKTNDINAMLQNMNLGVCTVIPGNRIHPEYSDYLRTIFVLEDMGNTDVLESLFKHSTLGVDAKDQISVALNSMVGEDSMMFDCNSHLLPNEMQWVDEAGNHKILQMDWSPIIGNADVVEKVLLIVQDVTHLRELEVASAQQKEDLEIISQIIKISMGKFNDFIDSSRKYMSENRKLIQESSGRNAEVIAALFRNMHTLKGNARTYEFSFITDAAHAAEQEYDRLRKDNEAEWDSAQMLAELDAVDAAIARYIEVNEDKLGRKGRAADLLTTRGIFVGSDVVAQLKSLVASVTARDSSDEVLKLQNMVNNIGLIPLQRLVSGAVDSLSSLAKELKKPTPTVEIQNGDIAFNNLFAEALKSSFMHIVRNSLDHGIEAPEERRGASKPEHGQLHISCERRQNQVELHIADDGRGLALHKLHEKGLAAGLFGADEIPSPESVAETIFHAGLSTAESLTQVSGRGVGMDAVRAFLKEQGADIRVVLRQSTLQLYFTPFKFVISVPSSAFSH